MNYFIPKKWMQLLIGENFCRESMPTQFLCKSVLFSLMGYDSDQMNSVRYHQKCGYWKY